MEDDESVNTIEDGLLERLQTAYEDLHISSDSIQVKDIESDYTGKYLAIVDYDGTVSIWEYMEDKWVEQTVLRYRDLKFFRQEQRLFMRCDALVNVMRPTVIARWSHGPGRYLAVASNTASKAHVFGEHTEPPSPSSNEVPSGWHRKHTMASAGPITEMRFSPPHVEFTLATATITGMVIIHMLQDKNDIRSWRPIHAISVFRDQSINSLSWNRNPVHELPIIIASTDDIDAEEGQQVAVFAINSASVRPEVNMCFEKTSHVSCVAFAPSSGLNDSLLAVASGRKISLYLMNVEEFQVPDQFSPSLTSESR
ncbi:hypothetical protein M3Y97_01008900 [Aphelenchoides bicaudatus]|nr:hypothetical protein M3Y97_01008900 [Aphelenchoides bicaudatus]